MLFIILTGSALRREREHGTVEHLLLMPGRAAVIMPAKVVRRAGRVAGGRAVTHLSDPRVRKMASSREVSCDLRAFAAASISEASSHSRLCPRYCGPAIVHLLFPFDLHQLEGMTMAAFSNTVGG